MCLRTGLHGKDCTEGEGDIRFQYLSVSSHLTIRKVGDRLFYLREDVSIHRANLKYCGESPKIRFLSYFHIL